MSAGPQSSAAAAARPHPAPPRAPRAPGHRSSESNDRCRRGRSKPRSKLPHRSTPGARVAGVLVGPPWSHHMVTIVFQMTESCIRSVVISLLQCVAAVDWSAIILIPLPLRFMKTCDCQRSLDRYNTHDYTVALTALTGFIWCHSSLIPVSFCRTRKANQGTPSCELPSPSPPTIATRLPSSRPPSAVEEQLYIYIYIYLECSPNPMQTPIEARTPI